VSKTGSIGERTSTTQKDKAASPSAGCGSR
jgi:hypothetical protein